VIIRRPHFNGIRRQRNDRKRVNNKNSPQNTHNNPPTPPTGRQRKERGPHQVHLPLMTKGSLIEKKRHEQPGERRQRFARFDEYVEKQRFMRSLPNDIK